MNVKEVASSVHPTLRPAVVDALRGLHGPKATAILRALLDEEGTDACSETEDAKPLVVPGAGPGPWLYRWFLADGHGERTSGERRADATPAAHS